MKFSDYTADIVGTNLDEAKIEGDPKLFKAMETARENVRKFLENGGDKKSKEGMDLGAKLASAAVAYMESTLKRSKVNEGADVTKAAKELEKAVKQIEKIVKSNKKYFNLVFKEAYGEDSSDSGVSALYALFETDFSEILNNLGEDF